MESIGKRHLFGMAKVGSKGQIVIPKEAREIFDIKEGDNLFIIGDETEGLAILTTKRAHELFDFFFKKER
jgi:looped-hinge helix DNA binding domain, AbrB family